MAAIQALTAQAINVATESPHATLREVCKIEAANFTPGAKYLILASGFARQNSSANESILRLSHGTTLFEDGALAYEQLANAQMSHYGWMYMFTQPETAEDIILEMASSLTQVVTVEWAGIVAINLDDVGEQNTDYFYNEVTTDLLVNSATTFDGASVTFNGTGDDYWLIIGQAAISGTASNRDHLMALEDSGVGEVISIRVEGEDETEEVRGYILMSVLDQPYLSHTTKLTFGYDGDEYTVNSSRVMAINLSAFAQFAYQYEYSNSDIDDAPTWTHIASIAPNPMTTGDWLIWGCHAIAVGSETNQISTRLQINPDGSGLVSDPAYADNAPGQAGWDATDVVPVNLFRLRELTSGDTREINYDTTLTSGAGANIQRRTLVGIAMEKPTSGAVEHESGTLILSGANAVTVTGSEQSATSGVTTLTATNAIAATGHAESHAAAAISAANAIAANSEVTALAAASITADDAIDVNAHATSTAQVQLSATGAVSVDSEVIHLASASLSAENNVTAAAYQTAIGAAEITAQSTLTVDGEVIPNMVSGQLQVSAQGVIQADGHQLVTSGALSCSGHASITANGQGIVEATASLNALPEIEADGQTEVVSGHLSISATSTLNVNTIVHEAFGSVEIDHTGAITADGNQIVTGTATVTADGQVTVTNAEVFTPVNEITSGPIAISATPEIIVSNSAHDALAAVAVHASGAIEADALQVVLSNGLVIEATGEITVEQVITFQEVISGSLSLTAMGQIDSTGGYQIVTSSAELSAQPEIALNLRTDDALILFTHYYHARRKHS